MFAATAAAANVGPGGRPGEVEEIRGEERQAGEGQSGEGQERCASMDLGKNRSTLSFRNEYFPNGLG